MQFRFAIKSLVHGAVELSGRPERRRRKLQGDLFILTFHSFSSRKNQTAYGSLPIGRFEQQIQFLKRAFEVVSLEEGLVNLGRRRANAKPQLAITIDDGFRDNYDLAWPLLQQYSVPATIFLATDFIDSGRPPWPTQINEIFSQTTSWMMEWPFRENIKNLGGRAAAKQRLKNDWSRLVPKARFLELAKLRKHLGVPNRSLHSALTWAQVREMQNGGIKFGSHTVYHSILPAVPLLTMERELLDSKHRIESELQEPCQLFAYPNGDHNESSRNALETLGYKAAVTQDSGSNGYLSHSLALKRIEVPFNDPMPSFRARSSLALVRRKSGGLS